MPTALPSTHATRSCLSITASTLAFLLLGTIAYANMQTQAMSSDISLVQSSQESSMSTRATRRGVRNKAKAAKRGVETAPVITPRPSLRSIREKGAAPDSPESRSVWPTEIPERAGCGDGLILESETCDDGNKVSGDGCSASCALETGFDCDLYAHPTRCTERCGNGVVSISETCDDGNTDTGDGCSRYCKLEYGFTCNTSKPNACSAICGDGSILGAEQCDDSNKTSGDGCSATCLVE